MRKWILMGLSAIVVLVIGDPRNSALLSRSALAQDFDVNNPESVKAYREGFRIGAQKKCKADVEYRLTADGRAFGEREQAVADEFCKCSVDRIMALVSDEQIESLKTVMTDPSLKPQRQQAVAACAKSAEQGAN